MAHYQPVFGVTLGSARSKITTHRENQNIDVHFQLQHSPEDAGLSWYVEVGKRRKDYKNNYYSTKGYYYKAGLHQLKIDLMRDLSLLIGREISRPEIPRPWLKDRHKTTTDQISVIYHGIVSGCSFDLNASSNDIFSRNHLEDFV